MEVALRKRVKGGWWGGVAGTLAGLGTEYYPDGEPIEGTDLPTDTYPDYSSGEVDNPAMYPSGSTVGPQLTPEDLAAQTEGINWLAQLPNLINSAGKVVLTAEQIQAGMSAGAVVPQTNCPSGYMVGGRCVQQAAVPSTQLVPGISNNALLLIGGAVIAFSLFSSGGGRRR